MAKINQSDNYSANFGYCLRSSSIFYVPPLPIKTSVVVSNYWSFKNNTRVFLLVNWRNMSGELRKRESISFAESNVATLVPPNNFHGSCEIEAFSADDLRIPYSAIMGIYETKNAISMVHSYSRTYSQIEVEDGKTISDGHEGCWIIRDNSHLRSFAVIHNGCEIKESQRMLLAITNHKGITKTVQWIEESMSPFETRIIYPSQHFTDLHQFLEGREGTCSFDYELSKSFTRLLLGWEFLDLSQLQVTHSNFDYTKHETDFVDAQDPVAYMTIPTVNDYQQRVLVYPDKSPGDYMISRSGGKYSDLPPLLFDLPVESAEQLQFCKKDGKLPTRIVTAIQLSSVDDDSVIPSECSLGVVHAFRPLKRFHWGVWSSQFNSRLLITSYPQVYGEIGNPQIVIRFYSDQTAEILECKVFWRDISKDGLTASIVLDEKCPNPQFKNSKYGYISAWSEYGGFFMFTTLSKGRSISLEHTF